MLMGLKEGQEKMSKSEPDSALFMEDTAEDITRKVSQQSVDGQNYDLYIYVCMCMIFFECVYSWHTAAYKNMNTLYVVYICLYSLYVVLALCLYSYSKLS